MRINISETWLCVHLLVGVVVGQGANEENDSDFYFVWDRFPSGYTAAELGLFGNGGQSTSIVDYNSVNTTPPMFSWYKDNSFDNSSFTSAILVNSDAGNKTIARGYIADNGGKPPPDDSLSYFPCKFHAAVVSHMLWAKMLSPSKCP